MENCFVIGVQSQFYLALQILQGDELNEVVKAIFDPAPPASPAFTVTVWRSPRDARKSRLLLPGSMEWLSHALKGGAIDRALQLNNNLTLKRGGQAGEGEDD